MIRLKVKLAIFNLVSNLAVTLLFIILMPHLVERINLRQIDNDLINKREDVISLISSVGIEPFIQADSAYNFGSYNILKEEFISIEKALNGNYYNQIEVLKREIEDEIIEYRVHTYSIIIDEVPFILEIGKSLASIKQTKRNIISILLLFMAFFIVITFFTDLEYTRKILRPLDLIINKLKTISSPTEFDRTEIKTSTFDFKKLDEAMIDLMVRISTSFEKEREITSNISHEIMTPVSVLRSKLENMLLKEGLDQETETKIDESLKTLHRLQSLVSSLLLISRIESHQYLKKDTFSLKELLNEIIIELSPLAVEGGIRLNYEHSEDLEVLKANRSLIFSMFYNVINNAIKNSKEEGVVTIESRSVESRFTVSVADEGRGMGTGQVKNLFMRFRNRTHGSGDGTGIGLAITKTIADFHNIDIKVESEPAKGARFFFIFPLSS